MDEERPDPDQLLARVQAENAKQARGKLKIFFGMAPGVGKTYAMLLAARKVAKEGIDIVVGYVEPHVRPETQALVMGLDLLPRRTLTQHGKTVQEFDLEGAIARKPQVVLVDELAHSNAEGTTHAKRWQDVQDLLQAGIDVYTTLNVQHLESLNDVVAQVTTIPVRETVPDHVFEEADEVELVDIAPDELLERLREGKVYLPAQAYRAIENFFRKGNLLALRELSLRKTAERVGAQANDYRLQHDVARIWPTSERLLVCVGPSPMSARLVRATRRMATSLRAPWTALHVELDQQALTGDGDKQRLEHNLRLAEELGGEVRHVAGNNLAMAVLEFARSHNVTKIVLGKPQPTRFAWPWQSRFTDQLIRECGDIDIYFISGDEPDTATKLAKREAGPVRRGPYLKAVAIVAICSAISWMLSPFLEITNLIMFFLAGVVAVALTTGRGPAILATVLSVAVFDLFFVPPYGTFAVTDTQYLLTFGVMLGTGLVISELTARVRAQTEAAREREQKTAALLALSKELTLLPTQEAVAQTAQGLVAQALDAESWIVVPDEQGKLRTLMTSAQFAPPEKDDAVMRWSFDHRQLAGAGTDTLPGTRATYIPLLVTEGVLGVLGVRPKQEGNSLTSAQRELLQAFASQIAGALERCSLARQAEQVRLQVETEQLRNALLSAVSHDLRTPLATITGAASLLVDKPEQLSAETSHDLAESIMDEADRLHRLVTNLLDLTKLEAKAIELQRELQPIEEVIGVVLDRMERQLKGHPLTMELPAELPLVPIDGLLIQQVLINLLDNAMKFSPSDGPITLRAWQQEQLLWVEVADKGQGFSSSDAEKLFAKFYRGNRQSGVGSGIGLAICRGIVELHGGKIVAESVPGEGSRFRFSLPLHVAGIDGAEKLPLH